jgi:DNA polymerase-3 subunit beta
MNIIINSASLLKQLNALKGVLLSNPIMPILENFLFDVNGQKLTITASDMQNTITAEVNVDSDTDGRICIPARMFMETLQNLPEQPITIKANLETFAVEIVANKGRYRLAGEDSSDYPLPRTTQKSTNSIELQSEVLSSAIAYTLFAVSKDEMKPAMNGMYVNIKPDKADFVTTDSYRLVRYRRTDVTSETEISVILPKKALSLLKGALPDNSMVKLGFTNSNAFFEFGNMKLVCRLIDERFPDYENVIPLNNSNVLTFDKKETLGALKRVGIYANKTTNLLKLKLDLEHSFVVSAENTDFASEASENVEAEYMGAEMLVGFQYFMLAEMLSAILTENIKLSLSAPNRAALILPQYQTANEEVLMLIMPLSLDAYRY